MDQRRIGTRSVSAIGLGAMPMSVRDVNDEGRGVRTIHAALDAGVTLIDTADAYSIDEDSFGHNELLIARALREYGGDTSGVLVATKGGHTRRGSDWQLDGRPDYLRKACLASIGRLGVERIDLYQHHRPDPAVPYDETVGGAEAAARRGADRGRRDLQRRPRPDPDGEGHPRRRPGAVQNEFSPAFRCSEPEIDGVRGARPGLPGLEPARGMSDAADLGDRWETSRRWPQARREPAAGVPGLGALLSDVVIPIPGASRPESVRDSAPPSPWCSTTRTSRRWTSRRPRVAARGRARARRASRGPGRRCRR